jgi:FAD/FMN-containing dehydrogenase
VLNFSKYMNRIPAAEAEGRHARIEPGVINDQLPLAVRQHGLTFAPEHAQGRWTARRGISLTAWRCLSVFP